MKIQFWLLRRQPEWACLPKMVHDTTTTPWTKHQLSCQLQRPGPTCNTRLTVPNRCIVKITGEMTLSFPTGIIKVFTNNPSPAVLTFKLKNTSRLEQILPNQQLLYRWAALSVGGGSRSGAFFRFLSDVRTVTHVIFLFRPFVAFCFKAIIRK